ncbi:Regulator of Chromosome Condensation (RCC1) repeat protein [Ureibacillus xyleni]|uniref:Regulator of Chromosome Condensation (RCC1) repeat protein n=1 Tax=Ureibacillus xyleni TaxID=614648 RepID=A0A285SQI0_9BACL|nr:DUF5050 domain-containing protein [Ureibacillus xyleni]SOC08470.1 Regulator of Chromosome Condensation (RCC1) repeat protein [Ureibacillus xyleni]
MKKVYLFSVSLFFLLIFAIQVSAEGNLVADKTHVYYVNHWDSKTGIYKEKSDGSGKELILPIAVDVDDQQLEIIGVKNDWIYYSYKNYYIKEHGIYKVQTNGQNNELISNLNYESYDMKLSGSWIFYVERFYSNNIECDYILYRVNIVNGKQEQLDSCMKYPNFEVINGYIYFVNMVKNKDVVLTRVNLDGSKKHLYSNIDMEGIYFDIVGDWIYYRDDNTPSNVYRVNSKTGKKQALTSHKERSFYSADAIEISGGYIYYNIWSDKQEVFELYRTKLDGTGDQKIGPIYNSFYIANNRIYSFSLLKEQMKIYTINGSKVTNVKANGNSTANQKIEKISIQPKYGNQLYPGFGKGINSTARFVLGKNKRIYLLENGTLKKLDGNLTNVHQFAETTGYNLVVLRSDGTVWQWDGNTDNKKEKFLPAIGIKKKVKDITGNSLFDSFALLENGNVVRLVFNPVQRGTTEKEILIPGLKDIVQISASDSYALALKKDGTVWAWGENEYGQLGNGKKSYQYQNPAKIAGLKDVVQIYTDDTFALALKKDGTVWAWGENEVGQLGKAGSTKPIMLKGLSKIVKLSPGDTNFAIDINGDVWAWGANHYGQMANNNIKYKWSSDDDPAFLTIDTYYIPLPNPTPVKIKGISNVEDIAIEFPGQVTALTKNGEIYKWGNLSDDYLTYDGYYDESMNEEMINQRKLQLTPKLITTMPK